MALGIGKKIEDACRTDGTGNARSVDEALGFPFWFDQILEPALAYLTCPKMRPFEAGAVAVRTRDRSCSCMMNLVQAFTPKTTSRLDAECVPR